MRKRIFPFCGIFIIVFLFSSPAIGQGNAIRGDLTQDGVIDGRDALQVMKIIQGIDPSTEQALQLGDVFPLPGLNGKFVGDGKLTKEDAEKILRSAVGLVPVGELNADFSGSAPVIDSFEPENGTVGTRVTIYGSNFVSGLPGENAVLFGDVPAIILASNGTQLESEVPPGAVSQLIHVQTPGGQADSPYEFIVTENRDGVLRLGGTLNPQDFVVSSGFMETEAVGANGQFQAAMPNDRIVLLGATPKDERETNFYSLIVPSIDPTSGKVITRAAIDPLEVNALTTAKSLIFLCPLFMNRNPQAAKYLMDLLDTVPEVQELAAVIETRYSQGASGVDDPVVEAALLKAIQATIGRLPPSMTVPLQDSAQTLKTTAPSREWTSSFPSYLLPLSGMNESLSFVQPSDAIQENTLPNLLRGIDLHFINHKYDRGNNSIVSYLDNNYSPVDWLITIDRISESSLPQGINEQFNRLRLRPVELSGYRKATIVAGNLWTQNIDIVYVLIDRGINEIVSFLGLSQDNVLPLEDNEEGVYFLRAYSGAVKGHTGKDREEFAAIQSIPGGQDCQYFACGVNLVLAGVDMWDLFTGDSKTWQRSVVKKSIKNATRKLSQEWSRIQGAGSTRDWLISAGQIIIEVIKNVFTEIPSMGISAIKNKIAKDGSKMFNATNKLLLILDKVSSTGRIIERLMGLWGKMMNPYGLEIVPGPSPMETAILVMGDPFSPIITDMAPTEGGPGTIVTLYGKKFAPLPGDNFVYLDRDDNIPAKVVAVRKNGTELDFEVPSVLMQGNFYPVILRTIASVRDAQAPRSFLLKRTPYVTGLSKERGFAPGKESTPDPNDYYANYFDQLAGTSVIVQGRGLYSRTVVNDILVIGNKEYLISPSGDSEYEPFLVPDIPPGDYDVYIRYPSLNNRESLRFNFTVLGAPVLQSIEPSKAKLGEIITLRGSNFGDEKNTLFIRIGEQVIFPERIFGSQVNNNRVSFRLPTNMYILKDEPISVIVQTPAGKSNALPMTIESGFADVVWTELPSGFTIPVDNSTPGLVPDGKISLQEAAAFARGEIDPYSPPWDDHGTVTYEHFHERLNSSGEVDWIQGIVEGPKTVPAGPGLEYKKRYRINHNRDGSETTVLIESISLDEEGHQEEGDFIQGEKGGAEYNDRIIPSNRLNSNSEISADRCQLGNGDTVQLETLRLTNGGLRMQSGNTIGIQKLICENGNAITLTGNANTIQAGVERCPGDAVLVEDGAKNTIEVKIEKCGGNGITIRGGGGNTIWGNNNVFPDENPAKIQSAGGHGILLENTSNNRIISVRIEKCQGAGLYYKNAAFTKLENVLCVNNAGSGVVFDDSINNEVPRYCLGNNIGMELTGDKTRENTFNDFSTIPPDHSTVNRQKHAVYIHGGAALNSFNGGHLGYTSSHGVVIEGAGTDANVLSGNDDVSDYEWMTVRNCQGDGVQIRGGAKGNLLRRIHCYFCEGNGITITGSGTDFNQIERCAIGGGTHPYRVLQESHSVIIWTAGEEPCGGWGIYTESTYNTQIANCTFGLNKQGGISLRNIRTRAGDPAIPVSVEHNTFGYYIPMTAEDNLIVSNPAGWETGETEGDGILLENVQLAFMTDNHLREHDTGLKMTNTDSCLVQDTHLYKCRESGVTLLNAQKDRFESLSISQTAKTGLEVLNSQGVEFEHGNIQANQSGVGTLVKNSRDIKFTDSWFWKSAGGGIAIEESSNTAFQECTAAENEGDGYIVRAGSTHTVFDRGYADKNKGNGFLLENSQKIFLYGSEPRVGLFIFHNQKSGIAVNDCQQVHIGYEGKGVNIVESGEQAVSIDGENTNDVQIASSMIMWQVNLFGKPGLAVKNGKNILVGGYDPTERNNFELGNSAGIQVEGEKTEISIINNLIGELEEYESGSQKWGNLYGIVASGRIGSLVIEKNTINANKYYGIWLLDGASFIRIFNNQITENGEHGICVEGAFTLRNTISGNSISRNFGKGIALLSGGNTNLPAPVITKSTWSAENIWGTAQAPDGSIVEVFADPDDEGLQRIGRGTVYRNTFQAAGYFKDEGSLKLHATVTDPQGNTSEFGPAFTKPADPLMSLVYTYTLAGNEDIYLQSPLNSSPARLTEHAADDFDPQFSLDGRQILFVSKRAGNADLWMMNNNGTAAQPLTTDPAADYDPDWMNPEGIIAFVSDRDGNPEIYVRTGGSGGPVEEVAYFQGEQSGYFSTDAGSLIGVHFPNLNATLQSFSYYLTDKPYDPANLKWKIFAFENGKPTDRILAEGDTVSTVQGWCTVKVNDLAVTSDILIGLEYVHSMYPTLGLTNEGDLSRTWMYSYSRWDKFTRGCVMIKAGIAGKGQTQSDIRITNNNAVDRYPAWSPDGTQIAFASNRSGSYEIWTMNADGTSPKQSTNDLGNCIKPAWSPDGKTVAFVSDKNGREDIYTLEIASGRTVRITETDSAETDPAWSRGGQTLFFASDRESGWEIYAMKWENQNTRRVTLALGDAYQPNIGPGALPSNESPAKRISPHGDLARTIPAAGSNLNLSAESITVKPGESFSIPVRVESGPSAANLAFALEFNEDILEWKEISRESFIENALFATNPETFPTYLKSLRANWVKVEGFTGNTTAISLQFALKAGAERGEYPIRFTDAQAYDLQLRSIPTTILDGKVIVDSGEVAVRNWMLH